MKADPPFFYERALRRIWLLTLAVAIIGTAAWFVSRSAHSAAGFLLGSALSILNFRGIEMLAGALGGASRPRFLALAFVAVRYAVIGLALYVIVRILGFEPLPVFGGLLAPFGAVILEILYETISSSQ